MSERKPWEADRTLDAAGAARAIREALPDLEAGAVTACGSGWDFDVFEAESGHVFRFPRRNDEQSRLRKDLALLPWIVNRVDAPVPDYQWGELRAPSFPYVFSGYVKLEGELAAALDPLDLDIDTLGSNLGRFFRALHALEPPPEIVEAGRLDAPRKTAGPLRDFLRKYLPEFEVRYPVLAERARRFFDLPDPPDHDGPLTLLHDDLHAEHLLLDPVAPRITGILDWSDAVFADPARDLACIYPWGGDPLLAAMKVGYGVADPAFYDRVRFVGTALAFQDLEWWVHVGRLDWAERPLRVLDAALPR